MNQTNSKKLSQYLKDDGSELKSILSNLKKTATLNQKLSLYLDATTMKYCQVANLIDDRLVIVTANSAIATQIRFQTTDLLRQFKQDPYLQKIKTIHCKVSPGQTITRQTNYPTKRVQLASPKTIQAILDIANSIEDPKLRAAMKKVANSMDKLLTSRNHR